MPMVVLLAVAAVAAAPALAQATPQTPPPQQTLQTPQTPAVPAEKPGERRGYRYDHRGPGPGARMFGNVSEEGRALLSGALRSSTPEERAALRAARDRVNALIAADRLDVPALRRAMEEERRLVDQQHRRRQAALLEAVQKLSVADRKAFAADAGTGRRMAERRAEEWRAWAEAYRRRMRDMPPPPMPPPPAPPGTF